MKPLQLLWVFVGVLSILGAAGLMVERVEGLVEHRWPAQVTPRDESNTKLTIATLNIRHGEGASGHVDLRPVAEFAKAHELDVLFVNEVDYLWTRSGRQDQTAVLADLAGMPGSFFAPAMRVMPWLGAESPAYGNALLTRVPWSTVQSIPLPRLGNNEPRNLLVARLPFGPKTLTVIGTHLSTDRAERMAQIEFILERFAPDEQPILLMGDFNATPQGPDIQALVAAGWVDLWDRFAAEGRTHGTGLTYPAHAPRHRIDYIFASPEAAQTVMAIEVVPDELSDHLPLVVELDWSLLTR